MLKTVYFVHNKKVAKAIVDEMFVDYFVGMGAMRTEREAKDKAIAALKAPKPKPVQKPKPISDRKKEVVEDPPKQPKKAKSKGDKGTGLPGSIEWHEAKLMELKDFDAITKYTRDVTGNIPRKTGRSTVASFRRTALSMIRKHIKNGSQSG